MIDVIKLQTILTRCNGDWEYKQQAIRKLLKEGYMLFERDGKLRAVSILKE